MSVKSPSNMGLIKKFFGRWYLQQPTAGGGKIHLQEPKRKKMILFGTRIWNPFLVLEKKTPLIFYRNIILYIYIYIYENTSRKNMHHFFLVSQEKRHLFRRGWGGKGVLRKTNTFCRMQDDSEETRDVSSDVINPHLMVTKTLGCFLFYMDISKR